MKKLLINRAFATPLLGGQFWLKPFVFAFICHDLKVVAIRFRFNPGFSPKNVRGLMMGLLFCSLTVFSQTYSFTYQSIVRDYIVHLPTGYNVSNKYPLVINMHGYTSSASQQELYTQMDVVADTGKFIVVYPDGVSNAWNGGFGVNPTVDDVGFLSMMIDTVKKKFSVDSLKIFSCGLSAGGFMSFRLACELPNKIAAIAPVSGLMSDSTRIFCQSICPVPLMYMHGTADGVVNYNGALGYVSVDSTIKIWIGKNGCPQTPVVTNLPDINTSDLCTVTKYVYSPGLNSSEVIFYKITNGGHTWPGAVPVTSLGNTNEDFKASGEIWNFFRKHSLNCGVNGVNALPAADFGLEIYPNPSNGLFVIASDSPSRRASAEQGAKQSQVEVYTIFGECIYQSTRTSAHSQIDIHEAPAGIYFLQVRSGKSSSVLKLVKQ